MAATPNPHILTILAVAHRWDDGQAHVTDVQLLLSALRHILPTIISDAYAYRVGEGDPNNPDDPELSDEDWQGMANATALAQALGFGLDA